MKFLVFQHIAVEHPGIFRDFMQQDHIQWDTVELDEGQAIPHLSGYEALLVMGGPMDVWQVEEHPWLIDEKAAIRSAVLEHHMPYLGFCLGHQLLADALGGDVGMMPEPEVGIMTVETEPTTPDTSLFHTLGSPLTTLQWHSAGVTKAPEGSKVLASSPLCPVQALQIQHHAFSMQFHIEVTEDTVGEWAAIPEYANSLEKTLGADAINRFQAEVMETMPLLNNTARKIYDNFMRVVREQN